MKYSNLPIADCHIHTFWNMSLAEKEALLMKLMDQFRYDSVTILSIPFNANRKSRCRDFTENLSAFYFKSKYPDKIFAFSGLSPSYDENKNTAEFFLRQAEFYHKAGFDGIKMIEGRPNQRHVCGGFDEPKYQLVYKFAEENQIPITMHASASASGFRSGGILCGKKLDFMDCFNEIDSVLSKYPKLRLNLAHFFFITEYIDLAAEFLDKYENVYYDLTPSLFMYLDFQKKPKEWTAFFEKYQDRILYGTDVGSNPPDVDGSEAEMLVRMVRGFFEGDKPYREFDMDFTPMPLEENILRKIYKENMINFYNRKEPRKVDASVMREELEFVKKLRVFLDLKDVENIKLIETVF